MDLADSVQTGKYFEDVEEFWCQFLASLYITANEPSLLKADPTAHSYRFVWEGGLYKYGPVLIRLDIQSDGSGIMTSHIWGSVQAGEHQSGYPKYEKQLRTSQTNKVGEKSVRRFLQQIEKSSYWDMPISDNRLGNDGQSWFLEGTKDGRFHFVWRWVPHNRNFIKLGLLLVRMSKLSKWVKTIENIAYRKGRTRQKILFSLYMQWFRVKQWLSKL